MRTLTHVLTLAAGATLLGACATDQATSGDGPSAPVLRAAAGAAKTAPCDASRLRAEARDYFASSTDPIYTIIGDLGSAYKTGATATTTSKAFDALARISAVRLSALQKTGSTAAQGNTLALDLLTCMQSSVTAGLPTALSLEAAIDTGGLFVVRGATADTASAGVFSKLLTPAWGAQPSSGTWTQASNGTRFLFYGSPITPAANDPSVTTYGFDFSTVPAGLTFAPKLIVGTCFTPSGAQRIQHENEVLPLVTLNCDEPLTTATRGDASALGRMVAALGRLVAPKPAYAMFLAGGMGGLSGSFSPYYAIDARNLVVSFAGQPRNGFVNKTIPGTDGGYVTVIVTTAGKTPIRNALVTLTVAGNSGGFTASNVTATTDADGKAVFKQFTVDKAGGYTLTATAAFDQIPSNPSATSDLFNVKNK